MQLGRTTLNKKVILPQRELSQKARQALKRLLPSQYLMSVALQQLNIETVNPEAKIAAAVKTEQAPAVAGVAPTQAAPAPRVKQPFSTKAKAAIAAATATLLTPALAFAGTAQEAISAISSTVTEMLDRVVVGGLHMGPLGALVTTAAVLWLVKFGINAYQDVRNYKQPRGNVDTKNPTLRRMFRDLILPAVGGTTIVGGAMLLATALPEISALQFIFANPNAWFQTWWPVNWLSWFPFATIAGTLALRWAAFTVKDIKDTVKYHFFNHQRNPKQAGFGIKFMTNTLIHAGATFTITFTAHVCGIFANQLGNLVASFAHNSIQIGTRSLMELGVNFSAETLFNLGIQEGARSLASFGTEVGLAAVILGLATLTIHLVWGRGQKEADASTEKDKLPSLAVTSTKALAWGAGIGALLGTAGVGFTATTFASFAVALGFMFSYIHAMQSYKSGLNRQYKILQYYDERGMGLIVNTARNAFQFMYKVSVVMIDPLISTLGIGLLARTGNSVICALSGDLNTAEIIRAQGFVRYIKKEMYALRTTLFKSYNKVKTIAANGGSAADLCEEMAQAYELLAEQYELLSAGDLKDRAKLFGLNLPFLPNGAFNVGFPWSKQKRGEHDQRVIGELILYRASEFREKAADLRARAEEYGDKIKPATELNALVKDYEAEFRRACPVLFLIAGRFYTNFMPRSYDKKQIINDLVAQAMADFITFMDVVVLNDHGKIEVWAVPTNVVKDIKPGHEDELAIEDHENPNIDSRFEVYERKLQDIGDSLCEINHIDESALKLKYDTIRDHQIGGAAVADEVFPTAEVEDEYHLKEEKCFDPLTGETEEQEFRDVVYRALDGERSIGKRLRVFADGSHRILEAAPNPDGTMRWVEGQLPEFAPALLMLPGTDRHIVVGQAMRAGEGEAVLNGLTPDYHLVEELRCGRVPHPFPSGGAGAHFSPVLDMSEQGDMVTTFGKIKAEQIQASMQQRRYVDEHRVLLMHTMADIANMKLDVELTPAERQQLNQILETAYYLLPRRHSLTVPPFMTVSDADQLPFAVRYLLKYLLKAHSALRVMYTRLRGDKLPFSEDMRESPDDEVLCPYVELSSMKIKMVLDEESVDPRTKGEKKTIWIPLDLNKYNERFLACLKETRWLWKYIDEDKEAQLILDEGRETRVVTNQKGEARLRIPLSNHANEQWDVERFIEASQDVPFGPTLEIEGDQLYIEVPAPLEMQRFIDQGRIKGTVVAIHGEGENSEAGATSLRVDPDRWGKMGGNVPLIGWSLLRWKNENGQDWVTDSTRTLTMDGRIYRALSFNLRGMHNQEDMEVMSLYPQRDKEQLAQEPYVDEKDRVHIAMNKEEHERIKPWLAKVPYHHPLKQPRFSEKKGELIMDIVHYRHFVDVVCGETTYFAYAPTNRNEMPNQFTPEETMFLAEAVKRFKMTREEIEEFYFKEAA
ncbi:MAG: hypothetical protein ABIE84_06315 [bacterium]